MFFLFNTTNKQPLKSGNFGDVNFGNYLGHPVVIKRLKQQQHLQLQPPQSQPSSSSSSNNNSNNNPLQRQQQMKFVREAFISHLLLQPPQQQQQQQQQQQEDENINSKHVVKFWGACADPSNSNSNSKPWCLVYERMNGGNCEEVLMKKQRWSSWKKEDVMVVLKMCLEGARGLCWMHEKKVIHRDVSLRNLLLNDDNVVW